MEPMFQARGESSKEVSIIHYKKRMWGCLGITVS